MKTIIFLFCTFFLFNSITQANQCSVPSFGADGAANLEVNDQLIKLTKSKKIEHLIPPKIFNCDGDGLVKSDGESLCLQAFFCVKTDTHCTASRLHGGVFQIDKKNGALLKIKDVDLNPKTRKKNELHSSFDEELESKLCKDQTYGFVGNLETEKANPFRCLCTKDCKEPLKLSLYSAEQTRPSLTNKDLPEIIQGGKYSGCQGRSCPFSYVRGGKNSALYIPITQGQKTDFKDILNDHTNLLSEELIDTKKVDKGKWSKRYAKLTGQKTYDRVAYNTGLFKFSNILTGGLSSAEVKEAYGVDADDDAFSSYAINQSHIAGTLSKVSTLIGNLRNQLKCFPNKENPAILSGDNPASRTSIPRGKRKQAK